MKVKVRIASLSQREESLRLTVSSIRQQSIKAELFVCLNKYDHVPDFLEDGEWVMSDNRYGDAGRYIGVENDEGWILTIDDDLVYPPTYIEDMIDAANFTMCATTLHGKQFDKRPIKSYHKSFTANFRCLDEVDEWHIVDVGGTGVMCWNSLELRVSLSDFPTPNMADVYFAKLCHEQKVPILCLDHNKYYLTYTKPETTIWQQRGLAADLCTEVVNSFLK